MIKYSKNATNISKYYFSNLIFPLAVLDIMQKIED